MDGELEAEKGIQRPSKQILDTFYNLTSYHEGNRNSAALKLLSGLQESKDALPYCLERLVKGLASPRESARLGFAVVLTELLKSSPNVSCDEVFALMDKNLSTKAAGDNAKNNAIGQILCLMALIRSKKAMKALEKTVERLNDVIQERPFLEVAWAQALIALSISVNDESFRNTIWPAVKSYCNSNLDSCTPLALWIVLELDKNHQKYLRKKAKIFRDGNWPPTDEKSLKKLGEILGAGVRSVPSGVHPVEKSLLAAMMASEQLELFWSHTVCGYLLKHDDKLVSSVGIRMIGNALEMQPSKKQLKHILSTETLEHLLKALLDRRQAARFARSIAQAQLDSISNYILTNKANPSLQFSVLKKILDVSLNFDNVSGSNLVHRILSGLASEAASMTVDELITRLKTLKVGSSDALIIVRLLHRIFECSKNHQKAANQYRSKILRLLEDVAFKKSESIDFPASLSIGPAAELTRNVFMRCLDDLCVISTSRLPNRPRYELPSESLSILDDLIDAVIDRKQKRLVDECKVEMKPDRVSLAVKAAKTFHQLQKIKEDEGTMESRGFAVLLGYLLFWFLSEPEAYWQSLEDLLTCYEKSQEEQSTSGPQWTDVLIDMLLGILSRPHRHVRAPIQVAFHYFCPRFSLENIQPLLKALKPSETDNLAMEDDEEDEGEEIEDAVEEGDGNPEPFSSSGEESEAEENEEVVDESVDPEFRRAVEDALGDAALHSDTESTASDLSDEAMLKLDESLAAVFRQHLAGSAAKKSARDLAEQAQAFRVRCFDLLFVMLHSHPNAEVTTGILLPVLHVANEAVRISDQKNVFHRSRQIIERVVQTRSLPAISEEQSTHVLAKLTQSIKDLLEFARTSCTNPSVQQLAADCLRFLLKFGDGIQSEQKSEIFESEVRTLFGRRLQEYLNDRQCLTPTCVFTAAFQRRPQFFVENLPELIDAALSEQVRPFRRREACALIGCLLNKDGLSGIADKLDKKAASAWKRFVDHLHGGVLSLVAKTEAENENEEKTSKKMGDIFEIFALLRTVANLKDSVPLRKLQEETFVDELEKVAASKLGQMTGRLGQGPKKTKLSTLCSEIVKKLRIVKEEEEEEEANGETPAKRKKTKE